MWNACSVGTQEIWLLLLVDDLYLNQLKSEFSSANDIGCLGSQTQPAEIRILSSHAQIFRTEDTWLILAVNDPNLNRLKSQFQFHSSNVSCGESQSQLVRTGIRVCGFGIQVNFSHTGSGRFQFQPVDIKIKLLPVTMAVYDP